MRDGYSDCCALPFVRPHRERKPGGADLSARRGVSQLDAGTHRVRLQQVTTSRLDSKALRAAVPDLAARFIRQTTIRRFTVA